MFHARNKNINGPRLLPLFKEKSQRNNQIRIHKTISSLSEMQIRRAQKKKSEIRNLNISKHVTGDISKPTISSDIETMDHQSRNEVAHSSISSIIVEEGVFWDNHATSRSDRRILESNEPAPPTDGQGEFRDSRWQKIKRQFKKFKDAVTCTSDNSASDVCSISTSPVTSASVARTSPIDSKSMLTEENKMASIPDQYLIPTHEQPKIEDETTCVKIEDNDTLKTIENIPKPADSPKRSSEELMECSEPNLSSSSSIGKYWDNHPISRSCRNIFKANKPILEETIIQRGRSSPWKSVKNQSMSSEKQRKNKV